MAKQTSSFVFFLLYALCVIQPILAFGALFFVIAGMGAVGGRGGGNFEYVLLIAYLLVNVGIFRLILRGLRALRPGAGRLLPKLAIASPAIAIIAAYLFLAFSLQTQLRGETERRHCGNNTQTPLCGWYPCLQSVHQSSDDALERLGLERKGGKLISSYRNSLGGGNQPAGTEINDPIHPITLCLATAHSVNFSDISDEQFRKLVGPSAHQWDRYMLFYRPGQKHSLGGAE